MAKTGTIDRLAMALPESKGAGRYHRKNRQKIFTDLRRRRIPLAKAFIEQYNEGADTKSSAIYALNRVGHSSRTIPGYPDYVEELTEVYGGTDRMVKRLQSEVNMINEEMKRSFLYSVSTLFITAMTIVGVIRYSMMYTQLWHIIPAVILGVMILAPVFAAMNSSQGRLNMIIDKTAGPPVRKVDEVSQEVSKWRA